MFLIPLWAGAKESLLLGGTALIFACLISIPLGVYTAIHQNSWKDTAGMVFALFGVSMPNLLARPDVYPLIFT